MAHPRELLARIHAHLRTDYPDTNFQYVFEKAIPGTRMHPDIQVRAPGGALVCAVEIGYTRPEKLTAYRTVLKVPDVRWYDFDGHLHADVTTHIELVHQAVAPPLEVFGWLIREAVGCHTHECMADFCVDCSVTDERNDPVPCEAWGDSVWDEFVEYAAVDVLSVLLTDYARVCCLCFCDKCGTAWVADPEDDASVLTEDLRDLSAREFAAMHGGRRRLDWEQASTWVGRLGLALPPYHDWDLLWSPAPLSVTAVTTAAAADAPRSQARLAPAVAPSRLGIDLAETFESD